MIVDSFLFNDKIELLKLRLEYLSPFIDRFYIAESSIDHTGSEKKLIFKNNAHRFLKFLSKIEYCEVCKDGQYDENEGVFGIINPLSSKIIATSRTQLGRYLQELPGDNLIHYSDVDEIPVCDVIRNLDGNNFYALQGPLYYYFYNMKCVTFPFDRLPWGLVISSNMLSQEKTLTHFRNVIFKM